MDLSHFECCIEVSTNILVVVLTLLGICILNSRNVKTAIIHKDGFVKIPNLEDQLLGSNMHVLNENCPLRTRDNASSMFPLNAQQQINVLFVEKKRLNHFFHS